MEWSDEENDKYHSTSIKIQDKNVAKLRLTVIKIRGQPVK
jgi:hypothetical protein